MRRTRGSAFIVAVAVAAAALTSCNDNQTAGSGAPFALSDVHPTVTGVSVITHAGRRGANVVQALLALGALAPIGPIALAEGGQEYLVGRFAMAAHAAPAGSQYALFVIENRTHKVLSQVWPAPSRDTSLRAGWDYGMTGIGTAFPAFSPLADENGDPQGILWPAGRSQAFAFYAIFPRDALPITETGVTIGLALLGPDRQPWAAGRLY